MSAPRVLPDDPYNRALVANTHPADWIAPTPDGVYNLVVIGGGTAGLIAALGASALGGKVALIERHLLGGDCLNFGCVPSKAVIAAGHAAHAAPGTDPDFGAAMARMRRLRAEISHHDAAERLKREGVDVFLGAARFSGPDTVQVGGATLRFARAVIATGARALVPPIPGARDVGVHTNEDLFELTERPERLLVVGAGPIGCELAQAFARLGVQVTIVDLMDRILAVEEPEASALLAEAFAEEGVAMRTSAKVLRFERDGDARAAVIEVDGAQERLVADEILLAVGRAPNVDDLGLDVAGVAFDRHGVTVDAHLRTSNPRIYASGDVCSRFKFTHAADAMSRIVIQNALFFGRRKVDDLVIPWATYTDPEVAHVGITAAQAADRPDVLTFVEEIARNDRSLLEGETRGYARVHVLANGTILGATVVGRHAGELIAPIALAMTQDLGLGALADTILPYPTRTEVLKRVAAQWQRRRLTPFVARLLRTILRWRR